MKTRDEILMTDKAHRQWIPLLEFAAREVFELMLKSELTVSGSPTAVNHEITAMVGLAGKLCGILSIQCTKECATMMATKMLGTASETRGEHAQDAMGEIANMVAGNFKNKITGLSEGCLLSVPTVITGNDYSMHSLVDSPGVEVTALFEGMPILITLRVQS